MTTENELVTIGADNRVMTTSLNIAENFGKDHNIVMRRIRSLGCSAEFSQCNFASANYLDKQKKPREMYDITRDGFVYLAMGFTGKPAAEFKEKYIAAFNIMEKELQKRSVPTSIDSGMLKQIAANMERLEVERDHAIETKAHISNKKTATALARTGHMSTKLKKAEIENASLKNEIEINDEVAVQRSNRKTFKQNRSDIRCALCGKIIKLGTYAVAKPVGRTWTGMVHQGCNEKYLNISVRNGRD